MIGILELPLNEALERAPMGELADIMDVGYACAALASPFARHITDNISITSCGDSSRDLATS